eukprot:GILI01013133.1.p1 GENE.GILI01013133.1~~GILI01013133.1.p1  ORF type:complete len:607 (+),score=112.54 GILI01013133.1:132-1952(+)
MIKFDRASGLLFSLAVLNVMSGAMFSVLSPFYPMTAESKGVSQIVIGAIFSCFAFINFLASPVFGYFARHIGRRNMILFGMLMEGISTVGFAFIDHLPVNWFVGVSFLIRVFQGLGTAATNTATFSVVAGEFPEKMADVLALNETCLGLGMVLGPPIGGFLFEYGSFSLPFIVMGGLYILAIPIIRAFLPPEKVYDDSQSDISIWQMLCIPDVILACTSIFFSMASVGFVNPTLADHLFQFGLSTTTVGFFFVIPTFTYALCGPIISTLSKKMGYISILSLGLLLSALCFVLIGPSPLFPFFPVNLTTVSIALLLLGVGASFALIPAMPFMIESVAHKGEHAVDVVSGITTSAFALGEICGPLVGSGLVQSFDFPWAATIFAGSLLVASILLVPVHSAFLRCYHKSGTEEQEYALVQDEEQSAAYEGQEAEEEGERKHPGHHEGELRGVLVHHDGKEGDRRHEGKNVRFSLDEGRESQNGSRRSSKTIPGTKSMEGYSLLANPREPTQSVSINRPSASSALLSTSTPSFNAALSRSPSIFRTGSLSSSPFLSSSPLAALRGMDAHRRLVAFHPHRMPDPHAFAALSFTDAHNAHSQHSPDRSHDRL